MPNKIIKGRRIGDNHYEEHVDWVFPHDERGGPSGELADMVKRAHKWKAEQNKSV